jgi:hypothetical protein
MELKLLLLTRHMASALVRLAYFLTAHFEKAADRPHANFYVVRGAITGFGWYDLAKW